MIVEHANTIGDCAAMQKEPVCTQLREFLRKYVAHLVTARKSSVTEADLQRVLEIDEQMHNDMQSLMKVAIDDGTPIAVPLVNTFNDVTSSHDADDATQPARSVGRYADDRDSCRSGERSAGHE